MNDILLARIIHVLAVVHWIGGVSFVTLVVLPLARRLHDKELFVSVEHQFSAQVRFSLPLAGAAGFWMTWRLDLWWRFADADFWWMTAMLGVWAVFMLLVFVVEPLMGARLLKQLEANPTAMLGRLGRVHSILLAAAAVAIFGTLAGVHG